MRIYTHAHTLPNTRYIQAHTPFPTVTFPCTSCLSLSLVVMIHSSTSDHLNLQQVSQLVPFTFQQQKEFTDFVDPGLLQMSRQETQCSVVKGAIQLVSFLQHNLIA